MNNRKNYFEHSGKAIGAGGGFEHVMSVALNSRGGYKEGIIRCITSREGDVEIAGYVDRSELHKVQSNSPEHFEIGDRLVIKNESEIINQIGGMDREFIGLEDPDIWIDEKTGLMHVYFTIPLRSRTNQPDLIHLGHAVGKDIDSLVMTMPVLMSGKEGNSGKEVSIAPVNRNKFRYNLVESAEEGKEFWYSTIRVAIAEDMGMPWKFGDTLFNPEDHAITWIAGHASPGPLLPDTFMDVGEGKRLGIINGREANQKEGDKIKYGMFSVGLFIYDFENGKIDWVSPEPFIRDSQAKTITFASQFVETKKGSGILYAHVDDSFVRAYTISADTIMLLLPH
ncbi:MAG TPA: hypothetical protein VFG10_13540 [Saprospiraceae bacterium]|nr:hypothetical protein [Saprospiraceae bacterium]